MATVRVINVFVGVGSTDFFLFDRDIITPLFCFCNGQLNIIFSYNFKGSQCEIPLSFFFALVKTLNALCINALSDSHRMQLKKSQYLIIYITLHTEKQENTPRNHCYKSINLHTSTLSELCYHNQIPRTLCISTLCTE